MPGMILDLQTIGRRNFVGLKTSYAKIARQTLREMAAYWHREIFPRHFSSRNLTKYKIEARTKLYIDKIKPRLGVGVGRFRLMMLTGQSQRWMESLGRVSGPGTRVTVRMPAPRHFTNPFVGTFIQPKTGKRKYVSRQPNKVAEVTRFDAEDNADLRRRGRWRLAQLFREAQRQAAADTTPAPQ